MCGIYWFLANNSKTDKSVINESFNKGVGRGPDFTKLVEYKKNIIGFHRLSINDLSEEGNQPFFIDSCILICNGEIYNYKELIEKYDFEVNSNSDCEVIIHLYKKLGIHGMLNELDGVFAFVLYDQIEDQVIVARDVYGVRPMFYNFTDTTLEISSEIKMQSHDLSNCIQFPPNKVMVFKPEKLKIFRTMCVNYHKRNETPITKNIHKTIYQALNNAVVKRLNTTERPIACLLSGGLDSSIIASLINNNTDTKLKTFSIGLSDSVDIVHSRIMANYLKSDHTEIIVTEKEMLESIPIVIKAIESYDTTTVRASVGNYLLGKYISENSDCKVIFNGDGADEVAGGYLYFKKAPTDMEFDTECKRLLNDISFFDVLRSDRSMSSDHGLEARTPWLDKTFVETYLRIDLDERVSKNKQEKFILRESFKHILPEEIYNRRKEAFSDGVAGKSKSWYEIIQESIDKNITIGKYSHNCPTTIEQSYYREIFNSYYKNADHIIPYFWMPKYVNATDSSARTLDIY